MSAIKEHFHDKIESGMRISDHATPDSTSITKFVMEIRKMPVSENQRIKRNPEI